MKGRMTTINDRFSICNCLTGSFADQIAGDVIRGLTAPQKFLPSKYFYDARGSRLFEEICRLPEYYLTRTELSILEKERFRIMQPFSGGDLVEMGSGSCWKISRLIQACRGCEEGQDIRYIPVDVSEAAVRVAGEELTAEFPRIRVLGFVADFNTHLHFIPDTAKKYIMLLGSTIGNFSDETMQTLIAEVAATMHVGDRFLIGLDMVKDPAVIEAAYNDSRGVTREFNRNILNVVNRRLSADFPPGDFDHLAFYNPYLERVEMHLFARRDMKVTFGAIDLAVEIKKGETIHTEISRKFRKDAVTDLFTASGLSVERWFSDSQEWFSLAELVKE